MPNPDDGALAAAEPPVPDDNSASGIKVDAAGNSVVEPGMPPIPPQGAPARPASASRGAVQGKRAAFLAADHVVTRHSLNG